MGGLRDGLTPWNGQPVVLSVGGQETSGESATSDLYMSLMMLSIIVKCGNVSDVSETENKKDMRLIQCTFVLFTGAGVFLLTSAESEQISFLFDCVVRGISPTRGPFGLRPVLPGQYQRCLVLLSWKVLKKQNNCIHGNV